MGIPCHYVLVPSIDHIITCRASRLSRRWPFRPSDRSDLAQGMRLHLIRRWQRFDPSRGTELMFAEAVLSTWELQQLRDANRLKRKGHHQSRPIGSVTETELYSREWRDVESLIDARDLLERCLERLDSSEQSLLRLLQVHSERRLQDILGVSRRQIQNQLELIRAKCSDLKKSD
mgnify:FL=1